MKRGIFDTLRRGVDNALANWQLALIRWIEFLVFAAIAVAAVLAILVPILVSIGIQVSDLSNPDNVENVMRSLFGRWMILIWIFVAVVILLIIYGALHSFVEAGSARVLVDGDRAAGPAVEGPRTRYRVFSLERWMAGGKDGWWEVFWIYNAVWGLGLLILLIPLIPTILGMVMFRENPGALAATACLGLAVFFLFAMVIAIVVGMWCTRAITEWATRRCGTGEAVSAGWAAVRSDLARHLVIALAIMVVAFAGSAFFAGFSFMASFGESISESGIFNLVTLPLRLFGTILNWGFSALITSWYAAAYAALAVEARR